MLPSLQQLGIEHLTPDERLQLIAEIWDTLEPENLGPIPESHRELLDRRIAEADASPDAGIPWEEALAQLRKRP
jgi:putative addiction module component (TIGR02574 family)